MVFDNPHLTGQYIPLYTLNIQGHFFHCSIVDLGRSFFKTFAPIRCAWEIFVWKSSKICFPQNHAIGSGKWDPPNRGSFLFKNSRFFQFEYGKKTQSQKSFPKNPTLETQTKMAVSTLSHVFLQGVPTKKNTQKSQHMCFFRPFRISKNILAFQSQVILFKTSGFPLKKPTFNSWGVPKKGAAFFRGT